MNLRPLWLPQLQPQCQHLSSVNASFYCSFVSTNLISYQSSLTQIFRLGQADLMHSHFHGAFIECISNESSNKSCTRGQSMRSPFNFPMLQIILEWIIFFSPHCELPQLVVSSWHIRIIISKKFPLFQSLCLSRCVFIPLKRVFRTLHHTASEAIDA